MKPYLSEENGIRNFSEKVKHYVVKQQNDYPENSARE